MIRDMMIRSMKRNLLVLGVVVAAACDLDVADLNDPSAGGEPTRSSVIATAQGLLTEARGMSVAGVRTFGVWGRESYDLRPEEPRPYVDNLIGPRDPLSSGSNTFFQYDELANIRELLRSVDAVTMTPEEKEAVRGWAKTAAAFAYFQIALAYTEFGAPLEPPEDPSGELAPVATGEELYGRAIELFDEAYQHLQDGGSVFPFGLTPGYEGFDSPQTFALVNRALKARTLKYMGRWNDVLAALEQSFLDPSGPLDRGAYHSYIAADAVFNPFVGASTDYIHPRIRDEAQLKIDGTLDDRALAKTTSISPVTVLDIRVSTRPNVYTSTTSPFPWITNEELILLRAEANIGVNNPSAALADINTIRTRAGGLEPLADAPAGEGLLDELLYNRLYSLLWQGGFAYWDAKQYDRLDQLPKALPRHVVFTRLNWPSSECLARGMTDGPCGSVVGQ